MKSRNPDVANFTHGDETNIGRIHAASWWMVWRHVAWLYYRWQGCLVRMTMYGGGVLWLVIARAPTPPRR